MNKSILSLICALAAWSACTASAQVAYVYCDEFYSSSFEYDPIGVGITTPYWECTFKEPAYIEPVELDGNRAAECWWSAAGYDGSRLDRGMEACSGNSTTELRFTEDGWYGLRLRVPSGDYPTDKDCIILQLFAHGRGGSWTGTLHVENNRLKIVHRSWLTTNHTTFELDADIERDVWIPIIIYWKPSTNPDIGKIKVWYDGDPKESPSYDYTGKMGFDAISDGMGGWLDGWVDEDTMISGIGLKWGMYCADAANYTPNETRTLYYDDVTQLKGNPVGAWELVNPEADGRDAFARIEAEYYSGQSGTVKEVCTDTDGGFNQTDLQNSDWIAYYDVNFDTGADGFEARVASTIEGNIEIRLDDPAATPIGSCPVSSTGGPQNWETVSADISTVSGKHNVYLKFTGGSGDLLSLNWFTFIGNAHVTFVNDSFDDGDIESNTLGIGTGFAVGDAGPGSGYAPVETGGKVIIDSPVNGGRRSYMASKENADTTIADGASYLFEDVSFDFASDDSGDGATHRTYLGIRDTAGAGDAQLNPGEGFYVEFGFGALSGNADGTSTFFYNNAANVKTTLATWTFDNLLITDGAVSSTVVLDIEMVVDPAGWSIDITGDTYNSGSAISFSGTHAASAIANTVDTGHAFAFNQSESPNLAMSIGHVVVAQPQEFPSVEPDVTGFSTDGTTVSLSWNSEEGFHYNVLSKTNLPDEAWSTNVAAIPGAGASSMTNLTTSGAPQEFFKIEAY